MDLNFENINCESSPAQPLIYPMINIVKSMAEATSDKIHDRSLRDETTNFSKPQADRALSNALKYGIFEMRKNQPGIADKFLDDVDTIYWQSRTKHEETPYRFNNNCDYINPEKDRHTFRKFIVSDDEKNISNREFKAFLNEAKGQNRNTVAQKIARHCRINKNCKRDESQKTGSKLNGTRQERLNKEKRIPQPRRSGKGKKKLYTRKAQVKGNKIKNTSKVRTPKKLLNKKVHDEKFITTTRESESQSPPRRKDVLKDPEYYDDEEINYQGVKDIYDYNDEQKEDDYHDLSNGEDYDDGCICECSVCVPYHLQECCDPYQAHYLKYFQKSSKGSAKKNVNAANKINEPRSKTHFTEHLKPTESKYQYRLENEFWCPVQEVCSNYNIYNMQLVKNGVRHWESKGDWLRNKLNNTQEKIVKQCDNALQIEPLDSLSCKNLEKISYIS